MSALPHDHRASVEISVGEARRAQAAWASRDLGDRAAMVMAVMHLLAREADAMASAITRTAGRPGREVWSAELVPTLDALDWLVRRGRSALAARPLARSMLQWYFRSSHHRLCWEPFGVVAVVTPATACLFLSVPQIAAALLAGNAVVWKPAPGGADVAFTIASLFYRSGLPPALLHVITGGAEAARDLVGAGVDKLHFTGGSEAGLALYVQHASHGRPAVLELSGRHVSVLLNPARVDLVARGLVWAKRSNRGRHCLSVQLVLAEAPAAELLLTALEEALRAPALHEEPLATADRARLSSLVDDALARGARRIAGSLDDVLVLADVHAGMRVVDEEVQGPLLGVATVDEAERAVDWINRRPHRLSASIWADDVARARRMARTLDVGQVWINDQLHPAAQPGVTLAGRGASGFGASRGAAGLMEMVQAKVVSETPLSRRRRHFDAATPAVVDLFRGTVRLRFARGGPERIAAGAFLARAIMRVVRGR